MRVVDLSLVAALPVESLILKAPSPIPARFHKAATSPYKVEVVKGTKPVFTFDLAAPAP